MKFSINYHDEISFEFTLARAASGRWEVEGVFPVFLGRPGRPHGSLFTKPNGPRFTPHATAWKGTAMQDRIWLPKFSPEAATRWNDEVGAAMHAEYVRSLEPVNLEAATEDGWTAHWVDWRVLRRWLRMRCRPGGTLFISADISDSLCAHLLRHFDLPRHLSPIRESVCLLLLRFPEGVEEPEMKFLCHFPEGVPAMDSAGRMEVVREPGWYAVDPEWVAPMSSRITGGTRFEAAALKVKEFLDRHPRGRSNDHRRPELPKLAAFLLGYCASDMVRLALGFVVEFEERGSARRASTG